MANLSNTGQGTYEADLEALFETLQEQRSALLAATREVQLAARLLVAEEARRLKTAAGPDDSRLERYSRADAAIVRRVAALEVEAQIAAIRVPPVTRTEALLQGRITDEADRATAHVLVTLVDEAGAPVNGVDPVQTDDSGYYAFILQPAQVEAIGTTRSLTLQIGSEGDRLVPAAATPFVLTAGQVTISETRLKAGELERLTGLTRPPLRPTAAGPIRKSPGPARTAQKKPAAKPAAKKR